MNKKCKQMYCTNHAIDDSQYCTEHTHLKPSRTKKFYKEHSFYSTAGWKLLSKQIREKFPICQRCNHQLSNVADHIYEIRLPTGMNYSMHEQNIQALCHSCHNTKTIKIQKTLIITRTEDDQEIIECTPQTFRVLRDEAHTIKQLHLIEEIERKYKAATQERDERKD
ncbi:hypothetical protein ABR855_12165 [Aeromonas hydrophila]|uniref:hypothetical protein n=1 Tax=Aeromonas hydrophila TaxID=644 RepID=UPI00330620E7